MALIRPSTSTIWFGILSIAWYIGLKLLSDNVLGDATTSLGLMIDPSQTRWTVNAVSERRQPWHFLLGAARPARNAAIAIPPHPVLGALPEVRDSLVAAADALLDAARAVIDAADRVLRSASDDSERSP